MKKRKRVRARLIREERVLSKSTNDALKTTTESGTGMIIGQNKLAGQWLGPGKYKSRPGLPSGLLRLLTRTILATAFKGRLTVRLSHEIGEVPIAAT